MEPERLVVTTSARCTLSGDCVNFTDKDGTKLDPTKMGMLPGIPQDVRHVITFKAVGDNRTEMTVTEYGYTSDQAHDLSKVGLEQCLDKMAAVVAKD